MPSIQSKLIKAGIRIRRLTSSSGKMSVAEMRQKFDEMLTKVPVPDGIRTTRTAYNGIPCDWLRLEQSSEKKIIFVHGGGYCIGSTRGYYSLAARIGIAAKAEVLLIDYRLAPEFPFPNGLADVVSVYEILSNQVGAENLSLVGDSAGGGLIVATLIKIREEGLNMPSSAVLLCPWLDLTLSGYSVTHVRRKDPMLTEGNLKFLAAKYIGTEDMKNPYASPIFGDYHGFPPVLVQAGEHDILRSDAERFAEKAQSQGSPTTLHVWKGMFHVWQFYARVLPEAEHAVQEIGKFITSPN